MKQHLAERLFHFVSNDSSLRSSQSAPGFAVGSVRGPAREDNQDRVLFAQLVGSQGTVAAVGVVCDGMGGMSSGGAAASLALSEFVSEIAFEIDELNRETLSIAISRANAKVFERFRGEGGSTITAIVTLDSGEDWVVHVGDSRLYTVGYHNELELITVDDTIAGVAQGNHKDEDLLDNRLLQFVGIGSDLEPHVFKMRTPRPKGYLITSDGAHGLGRKILESIIGGTHKPVDWVKRIVFVADAINVNDNATALAMAPQDLVCMDVFRGGTSIKAWTTNGCLELWLQKEDRLASAERYGQVGKIPEPILRADEPLPTQTIKPKPKPKAKTKLKRPPTKEVSPAEGPKGKPRPQLSIKFSGGHGGADD